MRERMRCQNRIVALEIPRRMQLGATKRECGTSKYPKIHKSRLAHAAQVFRINTNSFELAELHSATTAAAEWMRLGELLSVPQRVILRMQSSSWKTFVDQARSGVEQRATISCTIINELIAKFLASSEQHVGILRVNEFLWFCNLPFTTTINPSNNLVPEIYINNSGEKRDSRSIYSLISELERRTWMFNY